MSARHAILGLLMARPLHGYDIDGEFNKGLRRVCHVNISQIYAYLKSMEESGWVESETVYQQSNPPKKVYHVTSEGREEMGRWLNQPVETDRQLRDELLTKVYFAWQQAPHTLHELIDAQLVIQQKALDEVARHQQEATNMLTTVLTEAGRRHAKADLEWLFWLREQVETHFPAQETA